LVGLVEGGKITLKEASAKIGASYRQRERIRKTVKLQREREVIHDNTGRTSSDKLARAVEQEVLMLVKDWSQGQGSGHGKNTLLFMPGPKFSVRFHSLGTLKQKTLALSPCARSPFPQNL